MVTPIDWCTPTEMVGPCAEEGVTFEDGVKEAAIKLATRTLYEFTGRRWPGPHVDTIRPLTGTHPSRGQVCDEGQRIRLPGWPVVAVDTVKLNGAELVEGTHYVLVDRRYLLRLGDAAWPIWQDIRLPSTDDATLEVTYQWGATAPADAVAVCGILACQLALAMNPRTSKENRLPKRVTTLSRAGVTMAVVDPLTLFEKGLTGLVEVDLWVAAVRGSARNRPTAVRVVGRGRTQHRRS